MFGKSKGTSSAAITKDINEAIKTLSYLARAEKYFDLELKKNGQVSKPLLKIVDIIDPLRLIGETTTKIGKGQKLDESTARKIFATGQIVQIVEIANDILALNPKGLVSSDKTALSKLAERLNEAGRLAGVPIPKHAPGEMLLPKAKKEETLAAQKGEEKLTANTNANTSNDIIDTSIRPVAVDEPRAAKPRAENVEPTKIPASVAAKKAAETKITAQNENEAEEEPPYITPQSKATSSAGDFPTEYKAPSAWNSSQQPSAQSFRKLGGEVSQPAQAEPQYQQPQAQEKQFQQEPVVRQRASASTAPVENTQGADIEQSNNSTQSQKVVPLKQNRKEFNLPQKYFATSYAGMNLQEAAEIISELANNPANLEIVMLEHASRVKPVAEGREIIGDLLAIAPIADSFETGTEITDKKHLSVLKDAERIISICRDVASVTVEGFDRRKQKLFEKFIPEDIQRTVELARIAYPEVFSNGDAAGETVSNILLDFSDIILAHSEETGDKLFAELLSQVVSQIVLYAEHSDLRLKFDVVTKKNRLNSNPQPLNSRSEVAVLRAITFVPKIARQGQDVLHTDNISPAERETVNKALEILQLSYVHARDNYSAEINSFYDNKAA